VDLALAVALILAARRWRLGAATPFALYAMGYTGGSGGSGSRRLRSDYAHQFFGLPLNDWASIIVSSARCLVLSAIAGVSTSRPTTRARAQDSGRGSRRRAVDRGVAAGRQGGRAADDKEDEAADDKEDAKADAHRTDLTGVRRRPRRSTTSTATSPAGGYNYRDVWTPRLELALIAGVAGAGSRSPSGRWTLPGWPAWSGRVLDGGR